MPPSSVSSTRRWCSTTRSSRISTPTLQPRSDAESEGRGESRPRHAWLRARLFRAVLARSRRDRQPRPRQLRRGQCLHGRRWRAAAGRKACRRWPSAGARSPMSACLRAKKFCRAICKSLPACAGMRCARSARTDGAGARAAGDDAHLAVDHHRRRTTGSFGGRASLRSCGRRLTPPIARAGCRPAKDAVASIDLRSLLKTEQSDAARKIAADRSSRSSRASALPARRISAACGRSAKSVSIR